MIAVWAINATLVPTTKPNAKKRKQAVTFMTCLGAQGSNISPESGQTLR